jgi:hypothetical protein
MGEDSAKKAPQPSGLAFLKKPSNPEKIAALQQKLLAFPIRTPKIRPMLHCNMTQGQTRADVCNPWS